MKILAEAGGHCETWLEVGGTMECWRLCRRLGGTVCARGCGWRLWIGIGDFTEDWVVL